MNTRLVGALGEQLAARILRQNGYDIYSSNYVTSVGELDLIAVKEDVMCFIEVKTRKVGSMLPPREAVNLDKINNIKSAAANYLCRYKFNFKKIRYDIMEIYIDENYKYVDHNHIEGAFS